MQDDLGNITYEGPAIDDHEILTHLPDDLGSLIHQINGFILSHGVLHIRGACLDPSWHAIRTVMMGNLALHNLYPIIHPTDVPFGQDCVGDQFLLRDNLVHRLSAETGEIENLGLHLDDFIQSAVERPDEILIPQPLYNLESQGTVLNPGQLIMAYPPFCVKEASNKVSLKAIDAEELISFHAEFARQIADVPNGRKIRFITEP